MLRARGSAVAVDPIRRRHMQMINAVVVEQAFDGSLEREHAIATFNAHNAEVQSLVPPERLLVYEGGQGWEPLCDFLRVPVPATPYPKANTTEEFTSRFPVKR